MSITYTVKASDTWESVSSAFGISPGDLMTLNNLAPLADLANMGRFDVNTLIQSEGITQLQVPGTATPSGSGITSGVNYPLLIGAALIIYFAFFRK